MHVLVAYDRSRESQNALVSAFDIAETLDGTVTAVHVVAEDGANPGGDDSQDETVFEEARERAANHDVTFETELLSGDPIEVIPDYAEEAGVNVIYVGHRGMSGGADASAGGGRGPLGSVARGIVEQTDIPVTVFDRGL